jgi:antitoxin component YwqK of YwqJK toxin-antitoxin module
MKRSHPLYILLPVLLFLGFTASAQNDTLVYFLDKEFKSCKKQKAHYVGFGVKDNGKIKFTSYLNKTGILVLKGWFTDSTLSVKDGFFNFYDSLGFEASEGLFKNNKEEGYWVIWSSLGNISDSIYFEDGMDIEKVSFNYGDSGNLLTRTLNNATRKIREYTKWNDDGSLNQHFRLIDGNGNWSWYYPNGMVRRMRSYVNNNEDTLKYFKDNGVAMTETEAAEERKKDIDLAASAVAKSFAADGPTFPGGPSALSAFVQGQLNAMPDYIRRERGSVNSFYVKFYLNKKGYVETITVDGSAGSTLENYIFRIFRNMPAWDMKGRTEWGPVTYNLSLSTY